MAGTGVRIEGLKETVRTLEKFGVEASDLKAAFTRIGNMVVNEAKTLTPVRTGKLASSIKTSKTKNKSIIRAGRASVPYAGVIHYGGYNGITAQPFLTSAIENQEQATMRTLEDELHGLIRRLDLN